MQQHRKHIKCNKHQWHSNPPAPAWQGPPGCEGRLFNTQSSVPFNIPSAGEVSAIWCPAGQQSGGILYPLDHQFTTQQACCLSLGRSRKSMKFQCMSNAPENHQNGVSRPPKVSKMRSQEVPEVIKITKMLKKWNLMKTTVFTLLLRGWDIRIHENFHSKIIKKRYCNPNVIWTVQIRENMKKWCRRVSNGRPEFHQKSLKINSGPVWVDPCTQWSPK